MHRYNNPSNGSSHKQQRIALDTDSNKTYQGVLKPQQPATPAPSSTGTTTNAIRSTAAEAKARALMSQAEQRGVSKAKANTVQQDRISSQQYQSQVNLQKKKGYEKNRVSMANIKAAARPGGPRTTSQIEADNQAQRRKASAFEQEKQILGEGLDRGTGGGGVASTSFYAKSTSTSKNGNTNKAADAAEQRKKNSTTMKSSSPTKSSKGKGKGKQIEVDDEDITSPSSDDGKKSKSKRSPMSPAVAISKIPRAVRKHGKSYSETARAHKDDKSRSNIFEGTESQDRPKTRDVANRSESPLKTMDEMLRQAMKEAKANHPEHATLHVEDDSDDEGDDMEDEYEELIRANEQREREGGTPDLLLQRDVIIDHSIPLCPFCSAVLPPAPSPRLASLQIYLLAHQQIVPNPSVRNPNGMRLPVTVTANFCQLHEEEAVIIPEGLKRGWPKTIDFKGMTRRISRDHSAYLVEVITRKIGSCFRDAAEVEWQAKGIRRNVLSEWGSFDVEQPGYYGPRGYEIMVVELRRLFVDKLTLLTSLSCAPLDVTAFLRRVLVPEVAVCLIAEDLKIGRDEAIQVKEDSSAFGKAMFSMSEEDVEFVREEDARTKREEQEAVDRKEKEKEDKKRKEKEKRKKEKEEERIAAEKLIESAVVATKPKRQPKAVIDRSKLLKTSSPVASSASKKLSSAVNTPLGTVSKTGSTSSKTLDISSSDDEITILPKTKAVKDAEEARRKEKEQQQKRSLGAEISVKSSERKRRKIARIPSSSDAEQD